MTSSAPQIIEEGLNFEKKMKGLGLGPPGPHYLLHFCTNFGENAFVHREFQMALLL